MLRWLALDITVFICSVTDTCGFIPRPICSIIVFTRIVKWLGSLSGGRLKEALLTSVLPLNLYLIGRELFDKK